MGLGIFHSIILAMKLTRKEPCTSTGPKDFSYLKISEESGMANGNRHIIDIFKS